MDVKIIKIGMADLNITKAPNLLTTLGLGSCERIIRFNAEVWCK